MHSIAGRDRRRSISFLLLTRLPSSTLFPYTTLFRSLGADRGVGVQRRARILEDHGDLLSAHAFHQRLGAPAPAAVVLLHRHDAPIALLDAHVALQAVEQVAPCLARAQLDAAADPARRGAAQAGGRARVPALAAPAFADDAERPAGRDVQADPVHRAEERAPSARVEVGPQVLDA